MRNRPENVKQFRKLLPFGAQQLIARRLGISHQSVSKAIDKLDPRHQAVQEAVRIIGKSEAPETAKRLAELLNQPESSAPAA